MLTINKINSLAFYQKKLNNVQEKNVNVNEKTLDDDLTNKSLDFLALQNFSNIKRISFKSSDNKEYKNNLRTMIQNNESVMMGIVPRTFTAVDLNGDEFITHSIGEKNGTFLSAIDRLDEMKDLGINTLHILPIHPTGKKKALGTAGSIYSPKEFVTKDGSLALDPMLIDKNDSRTPNEQFKAFINECHKRDIKVMLDLPSCASVDLFEAEPKLMAIGRNGEDKTPQGWADIRMFNPWEDETKRTLNPNLLMMHKQYVDACIDLGIDGIRADVARAKPTEFWDILIKYSHKKDPEFAWLGEAYTYECASPQVNMPYDRPMDTLRAGFDEYYGQYHIFYDWKNATEFNENVILNLMMSRKLLKGKSCLGSFTTHDDKSAMLHGGKNYCNQTTIIQATLPMCNPYFIDGFQSGDYYDYQYSDKKIKQTFTQDKELFTHPYQLDIFNLSRKPGGKHPEIGRVMKKTFEMRRKNKDLFSDKESSFIVLDKKGDVSDKIITYARHNRKTGRTAIVIANKNVNRNITGTILVPHLKSNQKLVNMVPNYSKPSEFQVAKGEIRVDLAPASAYVFEINTPNIEKDRKGHVYRQK